MVRLFDPEIERKPKNGHRNYQGIICKGIIFSHFLIVRTSCLFAQTLVIKVLIQKKVLLLNCIVDIFLLPLHPSNHISFYYGKKEGSLCQSGNNTISS